MLWPLVVGNGFIKTLQNMSQKKIKPKDKRKYELLLNNKILQDRLIESYVLCSYLLVRYATDYPHIPSFDSLLVTKEQIQKFVDSNQGMIVEKLEDGSVKLRIGHLDESSDSVETSTT